MEIRNNQKELKNVLKEQFEGYKHIADYSQRFPNIIDDIIEKNNIATQELLKSIDERYAFIINTESSEYKHLKIVQSWFWEYASEIIFPGNKWSTREVRHYIDWLLSDYIPRTFEKPLFEIRYEERCETLIKLFTKIRDDLSLDDLAFLQLMTALNPYVSMIYGKRNTEFPYMEMWKELTRTVREQLTNTK